MTDCTQYEEMLSALLDNELSREDAALLRDHLKVCPDCRRTYRDFSAVSENMHTLVEEAPFVLASKVMIQAEKQPFAAPASVPVRKRRRSPLRIIIPTAAACLILTAAGIVTLTRPLNSADTVYESQALESYDTAETDAAEAPAEETEEENAAADNETVMYFNADSAAESTDEDPASDQTGEIMNVMVSDDQAEAFEAIISIGDGPTEDPQNLNILCTAEYKGVVYEFLTNDDSSALYWMDAAEGTEAIYSNSDVVTLFSVLGIS